MTCDLREACEVRSVAPWSYASLLPPRQHGIDISWLRLLSSVARTYPPQWSRNQYPICVYPCPSVVPKALLAISTVLAISSSVWTADTNAASNCDGGK